MGNASLELTFHTKDAGALTVSRLRTLASSAHEYTMQLPVATLDTPPPPCAAGADAPLVRALVGDLEVRRLVPRAPICRHFL